ncbi:MAG TPA: molecular chaperone TorD family protein [Burkholderiales bacterium]|nr:molecular chaperone TorD family protein [Burkholderiales bacterium]
MSLSPEEQARADFYGLIARLLYAAPDEQLISELVRAPLLEGEGALASAWRDMVEVCRSAFPVTLENEHTELFVGTGKAEVTPYLSHYILQRSSDNPLVDLRQQLAAWGIGRREEVPEYEDHISGICEAMRFAIAVQHRSPEEQRDYFERFVYRGAVAFCDAVSASPNARFYRLVAQFARSFFEIEKSAFEMVDG